MATPMNGDGPASDQQAEIQSMTETVIINPSSKRKRDEEEGNTAEAPNQEELKPTTITAPSVQHPLWKTSLCSYFRSKSGVCSHGETCRYAHSEEELRQRPDKTWDPTSERCRNVPKDDNDGDCDEGKLSSGEILMTEAFADDDDDECGDDFDKLLSKCLVNLPKNWDSANLKSFIDEQGVSCKSARKKKGMSVGFVKFESAGEVNNAVEALSGKLVGSKCLKVANVVCRPSEKKAKLIDLSKASDLSEDGNMEDGSKLNGLLSKTARDAVTPLAHMTYEDQLEHKKNAIAQMLKKLTRHARKACPNGTSLPEWILKSRDIGGLSCRLEGIVGSPLVNGYRNKCEFSVGYSMQGKPTVGFMLGNFREGVTAVDEPVDCPNVSEVACKCASVFQDFLRKSSLPVWNRFNNTGFWRQLTVREGRKPGKLVDVEISKVEISEVMVMVQVCTVGTNENIVESELERMSHAFAASSTSIPLKSLVVQDHLGISNVAPADAPLRSIPIQKVESDSTVEPAHTGEAARINDYINDLKFCISPTAFFQVNTLAAEKLYSLAGDWAGLGPDTLLFDICCGTGTIGLTLAHRVGMVVGIEMNASAVSDAHRNADINGIKNCRFVCSKAEDVMGSLLKEYLDESSSTTEIEQEPKNITVSEDLESQKQEQEPQELVLEKCTSSVTQFKHVVAIVDPPRAGLHPTVLKALRTHPRLKRLVYISCNPETLVANAIELCTPSVESSDKRNQGNVRWRKMSSAGLARQRTKSMPNSKPFSPVKATAVDLFPHTPHCEMVMLLER